LIRKIGLRKWNDANPPAERTGIAPLIGGPKDFWTGVITSGHRAGLIITLLVLVLVLVSAAASEKFRFRMDGSAGID